MRGFFILTNRFYRVIKIKNLFVLFGFGVLVGATIGRLYFGNRLINACPCSLSHACEAS